MLSALALAVAVSFAAPPRPAFEGRPLTVRLPSEVPGPEILARWELIQGWKDSPGFRVSYRFYVDPARSALYRVTQYRVTPETEKVLWNAQPGSGAPLECYELLPEGWRRLDPASERYRAEMAMAVRIYYVHRTLMMDRLEP